MGSTGVHRAPGMTDLQFMQQQWPRLKTDVVAHASAPAYPGDWHRVLYLAVRNPGTDEVWGLVVLIRQERDWTIYKEVSEDMGPAEDACPRRVLDALTPTEHEYARAWRERCRHNAERTRDGKIKAGDTLRFDHPFRFSDDVSTDTLTFVERNVFKREDGVRVRLPRWRAYGYGFVERSAA